MFAGSCWRRDGSGYGTSLLSARVFRGMVGISTRVSTPTTAVCRGSPRGVNRPDRNPETSAKRRTRDPSSLVSELGSKFSRRPRRTDGADALAAWRERPRPWPQAWQAKRPIRVVAHATGLLLATAPAVGHQAVGTERRQTTTGCNLRDDLQLPCELAAREPVRRP